MPLHRHHGDRHRALNVLPGLLASSPDSCFCTLVRIQEVHRGFLRLHTGRADRFQHHWTECLLRDARDTPTGQHPVHSQQETKHSASRPHPQTTLQPMTATLGGYLDFDRHLRHRGAGNSESSRHCFDSARVMVPCFAARTGDSVHR